MSHNAQLTLSAARLGVTALAMSVACAAFLKPGNEDAFKHARMKWQIQQRSNWITQFQRPATIILTAAKAFASSSGIISVITGPGLTTTMRMPSPQDENQEKDHRTLSHEHTKFGNRTRRLLAQANHRGLCRFVSNHAIHKVAGLLGCA